jgi:hypothetical protein
MLFSVLLPLTSAKSYDIRVACSYAVALVPGDGNGGGLIVTHPVVLGIRTTIQSGALAHLLDGLDSSIRTWKQQNNPREANAMYVFTVSIFSGAFTLPLLRIDQLRLRLKDVDS